MTQAAFFSSHFLVIAAVFPVNRWFSSHLPVGIIIMADRLMNRQAAGMLRAVLYCTRPLVTARRAIHLVHSFIARAALFSSRSLVIVAVLSVNRRFSSHLPIGIMVMADRLMNRQAAGMLRAVLYCTRPLVTAATVHIVCFVHSFVPQAALFSSRSLVIVAVLPVNRWFSSHLPVGIIIMADRLMNRQEAGMLRAVLFCTCLLAAATRRMRHLVHSFVPQAALYSSRSLVIVAVLPMNRLFSSSPLITMLQAVLHCARPLVTARRAIHLVHSFIARAALFSSRSLVIAAVLPMNSAPLITMLRVVLHCARPLVVMTVHQRSR